MPVARIKRPRINEARFDFHGRSLIYSLRVPAIVQSRTCTVKRVPHRHGNNQDTADRLDADPDQMWNDPHQCMYLTKLPVGVLTTEDRGRRRPGSSPIMFYQYASAILYERRR